MQMVWLRNEIFSNVALASKPNELVHFVAYQKAINLSMHEKCVQFFNLVKCGRIENG